MAGEGLNGVLLNRLGDVAVAGVTLSFETVWLAGFVVVAAYGIVMNAVLALRSRRRRQEANARVPMASSRQRLLGQTSGAAWFPDVWRRAAAGGNVILTADEAGVHFKFRSAKYQRWALVNARASWRGLDDGDLWYSDWGRIRVARRDRGGDGIFLVNDAGERVRFVGTFPREMAAFTQELLHRGVPVELVKTTYWDTFRSRGRWRSEV